MQLQLLQSWNITQAFCWPFFGCIGWFVGGWSSTWLHSSLWMVILLQIRNQCLGVSQGYNFGHELQTQSNLCFLDNTMQRWGKQRSSPSNADSPSRATSLPFKTNEFWAHVFFFFFSHPNNISSVIMLIDSSMLCWGNALISQFGELYHTKPLVKLQLGINL